MCFGTSATGSARGYLLDAAYDAPIIRERSKSLGHVAIIDINTRRNMKLKEELTAEARRCELLHFERPEDRRYKERTSIDSLVKTHRSVALVISDTTGSGVWVPAATTGSVLVRGHNG